MTMATMVHPQRVIRKFLNLLQHSHIKFNLSDKGVAFIDDIDEIALDDMSSNFDN